MSEQRDRILTHACELFLRDGLDGFSMRKLARMIGVTAPALYRHYESKEKVLHDVVGEAYRRMTQAVYRALEGATPQERLLLTGEGYVGFALEHPRLYDVLFASPELAGLGCLPDEVRAQGCAIGQFWKDRVRECMDAGVLRPGDPRDVALTMWAHAHGMVALYARGFLRFGEPLPEGEFRSLFRASSRRSLEGVARAPLNGRDPSSPEQVDSVGIEASGPGASSGAGALGLGAGGA